MHRKALTALLGAVAISVLLIAPSVASAWAPADQATVHPGVQVFTQGAQCTANFVYQDSSNVYLGQAAHCSGTGAATDTNGCDSGSLPIGTPVDVTGASRPGTLVYNSWLTMQSKGETDADTCAFNDLALIKLDPADVASVNPGIPGDSGSGFMNATGGAIGVLSTVQLAPLAASNGVGNLPMELAYLHANVPEFAGVNLVPGTESFNPNIVQAVLKGAGLKGLG